MTRLWPLLLALLLPACHPDREAPSPNPPRPPDTELCPQMCVHLRTLKCEEGQDYYDSDLPGKKGQPNATCEHFCKTQQDKGVFVNPRCVAQAPTCDQIEDWRQKTCP